MDNFLKHLGKPLEILNVCNGASRFPVDNAYIASLYVRPKYRQSTKKKYPNYRFRVVLDGGLIQVEHNLSFSHLTIIKLLKSSINLQSYPISKAQNTKLFPELVQKYRDYYFFGTISTTSIVCLATILNSHSNESATYHHFLS